MKKNIILAVALFFCYAGMSQVVITSGAQWVNTGNVTVTLQDIDMVNNGTFTPGNSTMRFTGSASNTIGGSSASAFYDLEIAKTGNNKLSLLTNTNISNRVVFTSGLIDLNQKNLTLIYPAYLNNESETSRIIGPNGGEAITTINLNGPNQVNPGFMGAIITSVQNMGIVTVKRGHKLQTGTGLSGSIARYFDIQPAVNTNLNATFRFKYFDAELNGQSENTMIMFKSIDNGTNWTNQNINARDAAQNFVEKTGINDFSRWTLSSASGGSLPVVGLEFTAKRINSTHVQLDWKTIQEINNLGFHIERKKETDNNYIDLGFVASKAPAGNSVFPLDYSKIDDNSFTGYTYYRLKQEDIDGHFAYSAIRMVNGQPDKTVAIKAWPIPVAGDFTILVTGIDKTGFVQIVDATGKLIRQLTVSDNVQQKVNKLPAGVYYLRLTGDKELSQKVVVQ